MRWANLEEFVEKATNPLLALLLFYALTRSLLAATAKVYWYDELLTWLVASQRNWHDIMAALWAPLDSQPPLFYLIEHICLRWLPHSELALRVPSAAAFVATLWCVFLYAQRASGRLVGLLCAVALLLSVVFRYYAEEARPYSLLMACVALALVCYQRAGSSKWLLLFAVTLALAQFLHYLALLCLVPFGLAELTRSVISRNMRWGVWAALVAGAGPIVSQLRLMLANREYYGAHHNFLGFRFSDIPQMYGDYLQTGSQIGTAAAITLAAAVGLTALWRNGPHQVAPQAAERVVEAVLLGTFVLLPFVAYVFGKAAHTGVTSRYALATVLGMTLSLGYLLANASRRAVLLVGIFLFTAVAINELHFWRFLSSERRANAERGSSTARMVASAGHDQLPVVIPNGDILWTARYAFPGRAERLVYLKKDFEHENDTLDRGVSLAARYVPIRVENVSGFFAANPSFLVLVEGPEPGLRWVTNEVRNAGWIVEQIRSDGFRELYLVENTRANASH